MSKFIVTIEDTQTGEREQYVNCYECAYELINKWNVPERLPGFRYLEMGFQKVFIEDSDTNEEITCCREVDSQI